MTRLRFAILSLPVGICLAFSYIMARLIFPIRQPPVEANNTRATLSATDSSIAEQLGDAAHAHEPSPESALLQGESATIYGITITLVDAHFAGRPTDWLGEWDYWMIECSVSNASSQLRYGLHPIVNSQVEYSSGGTFVWELPQVYYCTPSIERIGQGLEPGASFRCWLIYAAPANVSHVFWTYEVTGIGPDGNFEEGYIAFLVQ